MTTKPRAGRDPELLDVPERLLLMADGAGDPNGSPQYQRATEALYSVSYALRFRLKRELGVDRKVGPWRACGRSTGVRSPSTSGRTGGGRS
jgi:hypothetical protein